MYVNIRRNLKQWFYHTPVIWKLIEALQGIAYVADYYYYYRLPGHRRRLSLREINIEFASQCNLRCKFCSLDHYKPREIISRDILELFLDQVLEDDRFRKVEVINLHNGGEVLLHPKRLEMLEVLKSYKNKARALGKKFPEIRMLTNAMLLRPGLSDQIIALDVIDVIGISFDGGTPELFEEMRTNAVWGRFHENILAFHRLNRKAPKPVKMYAISCIPQDKPLHKDWMHPEFREIYDLLDWYELRRLHNWAGEVETLTVREKKHKIGCSMLMKQLVLLPNGDITVCCSDLNSKGVIGNIRERDVISIYRSKERMQYLELLLKGRKQELALCAGCETF